jgi:class 3 adenylate cyclase
MDLTSPTPDNAVSAYPVRSMSGFGSRVAAQAQADEVLVSSTVKDLVAGSRIEFADRGEHALKGVPETWHLFAAVA